MLPEAFGEQLLGKRENASFDPPEQRRINLLAKPPHFFQIHPAPPSGPGWFQTMSAIPGRRRTASWRTSTRTDIAAKGLEQAVAYRTTSWSSGAAGDPDLKHYPDPDDESGNSDNAEGLRAT